MAAHGYLFVSHLTEKVLYAYFYLVFNFGCLFVSLATQERKLDSKGLKSEILPESCLRQANLFQSLVSKEKFKWQVIADHLYKTLSVNTGNQCTDNIRLPLYQT